VQCPRTCMPARSESGPGMGWSQPKSAPSRCRGARHCTAGMLERHVPPPARANIAWRACCEPEAPHACGKENAVTHEEPQHPMQDLLDIAVVPRRLHRVRACARHDASVTSSALRRVRR
jgi:hypothetical protein